MKTNVYIKDFSNITLSEEEMLNNDLIEKHSVELKQKLEELTL